MVELFRVIATKSAKIKLRGIYNYTKKNTSAEVAKKIRDGLLEEADTLEKRPESKNSHRFANLM